MGLPTVPGGLADHRKSSLPRSGGTGSEYWRGWEGFRWLLHSCCHVVRSWRQNSLWETFVFQVPHVQKILTHENLTYAHFRSDVEKIFLMAMVMRCALCQVFSLLTYISILVGPLVTDGKLFLQRFPIGFDKQHIHLYYIWYYIWSLSHHACTEVWKKKLTAAAWAI